MVPDGEGESQYVHGGLRSEWGLRSRGPRRSDKEGGGCSNDGRKRVTVDPLGSKVELVSTVGETQDDPGLSGCPRLRPHVVTKRRDRTLDSCPRHDRRPWTFANSLTRRVYVYSYTRLVILVLLVVGRGFFPRFFFGKCPSFIDVYQLFVFF